MGAHQYATSEITVSAKGKSGKAYLDAVNEEFSAASLAEEGCMEDMSKDVSEGELPKAK